MRGMSRILLASILVALAVTPASARCSYITPGCAEWYMDYNGIYHSIRSDWAHIQGHGMRFTNHAYRHRPTRHPA
jgi:hypothetical protein